MSISAGGFTLTRKALIIHGPLSDLGDVLAIARHEGKKVLRSEKVRVEPFVQIVGEDYLVVVEESEAGCSKAFVVERGISHMVET